MFFKSNSRIAQEIDQVDVNLTQTARDLKILEQKIKELNLYQSKVTDVCDTGKVHFPFETYSKLIEVIEKACFSYSKCEYKVVSNLEYFNNEYFKKYNDLLKSQKNLLRLGRRLKASLVFTFSKNDDNREFLMRMIKLINPNKDLEDLNFTNSQISLILKFNKYDLKRKN